MGFTVVREGQRVAVWSIGGRCEFVDGPRFLVTCMKTVRRLRIHRATQYEYLQVHFLDGHIENFPGPTSMFFDPLEHSSIQVREAVNLAAHEVLVVYRREGEGGGDPHHRGAPGTEDATRVVIRGPKVHFPSNFEWQHNFEWHGEDPVRKAHIIPKAQKFTVLKLIPTSFYYNVKDVRTSDDALVSVKVMIFYEIADLERMLDTTEDPVADMVNAACSDIVSFVSSMDYCSFVENVSKLSDLDSIYGKLVSRSEAIGINITRVVYRGYHASENLQEMHDKAIERRTKLRLEGEAEATAQEIESLKLKGQTDRAQAKMEMEEMTKKHENALLNLDHEEALRRERLEMEENLNAERAQNEEKLAFYRSLRSLDVDLTKYLTAEYDVPDRTIRIEGGSGGNSHHQVHLHEGLEPYSSSSSSRKKK